MNNKIGVLLMNLGTPEDSDPRRVGEYLREFLMDRHVIDIPALMRWFLVHHIIVPRRARASSEAYQKIWTERGSPLKFHSEDLTAAVAARLGDEFDVKLAMRYQTPSVDSVLREWSGRKFSEIRVLPLYPQYATATSYSSEEVVLKSAKKLGIQAPFRFVRPFYGDSGFLDAFTLRTAETLKAGPWEHVLFSFHGLPERQIRKTDRTGTCLKDKNCCELPRKIEDDTCYRSHCYATAKGIATRLKIPSDRWSVSFQSRLGRTKWVEPYTDLVLPDLAREGIKNVVVVSPAFVADCLETIEEIGIRAVDLFQKAGGSTLRLVPSLNSEPYWADAVVKLVKGDSFR